METLHSRLKDEYREKLENSSQVYGDSHKAVWALKRNEYIIDLTLGDVSSIILAMDMPTESISIIFEMFNDKTT